MKTSKEATAKLQVRKGLNKGRGCASGEEGADPRVI